MLKINWFTGAAVAAAMALFLRSDSTPRGIRNNNPGNIRGSDSFTWDGETRRDNKNFVVFDTPWFGIRAMARTLRTYRQKHGVNTIGATIARWAPAADDNNTSAYIAHMSELVGKGTHEPLELDDYPRLVAGIIKHENGVQPYRLEVISDAVQAGLA